MQTQTEADPPEICAVVGAGRVGTALAAALRAAGIAVEGPLGRGEPVRTITAPCCCACRTGRSPSPPRTLEPGRLVGHTSGATTLDVRSAGLRGLLRCTRS